MHSDDTGGGLDGGAPQAASLMDSMLTLITVFLMFSQYNDVFDTIVSADDKGFIEYWQAVSGGKRCLAGERGPLANPANQSC